MIEIRSGELMEIITFLYLKTINTMADQQQEQIKYYPTQATIVRQSQLKMALDICSSRGIIPSVTELQRITDVLCDAVMQEPNQTLKNRIKKLDEWLYSKTVKNETI